jgi:hypothetical protein
MIFFLSRWPNNQSRYSSRSFKESKTNLSSGVSQILTWGTPPFILQESFSPMDVSKSGVIIQNANANQGTFGWGGLENG